MATAPSTKLVASAATVSPPGSTLSTSRTNIGYAGKERGASVVDEVRDVRLDVARVAVANDAQIPDAVPRRQHVADRTECRGRQRSPDDVRIARTVHPEFP